MNVFKKFLGEDDDYDEENVNMQNENDYTPSTAAATSNNNSTSKSTRNVEKSSPEFVLVKPMAREDLAGIADSLLERKTIVLNLEMVSKDTRRFVDFLSGVAYALQGQVKKIAESTFLIIPGGVAISGDIFDDFEEDNY